MFNKLKEKMIERYNKRILEYVLNTPDVWLEVLRVINNKYEHKIFNDLIIKENRFNHLKIDRLTVLGGVHIGNNTYIPEDNNFKDKKPFIELNEYRNKKD